MTFAPLLDDTHRPELTSWVESAQDQSTDFPIQNLPFGIFRPAGSSEMPRAGVAIGNQIADVRALLEEGLVDEPAVEAAERCTRPWLNDLMAIGNDAVGTLRGAISELLRADTQAGRRASGVARRILVPQADAELQLPARIGDYSDFYASIDHARNMGSMFRPDNPLLPNYKHIPIGYHGRASSIVASGEPVRRPAGQRRDNADLPPEHGLTRKLDYEVEVGAFIGTGNALGVPIPIAEAERHLFGLCLVNDWSARDIQAWEYQPLGPFLGKSFLTTLSPWVVTVHALEPFRALAYVRPDGDPAPLSYLLSEQDQRRGGFDITLEVSLRTAAMAAAGVPSVRLTRSRFAGMYWTIAQMITHHASNGCNLRPGDLLASGTVSGPERDARGCLQELTWRGRDPVRLPGGEVRSFLEDGDEVVMRGYCQREGFARIGFGECRGTVAVNAAAR
jgi:fumarylacetoacetase